MSAKLNFKMIQGSTFREVLRLESSTKVYVPITNITSTAPVVITAANHGIKAGWRVKITNVGGMKEINSTETYHIVTSANTNDITINAINAVGYTTYTTGGILEYNQPVSLADTEAVMHIRTKLKSDTVLEELTSDAGQIILDDTNHTITILLSDEITANFSFNTAVYSLELITTSGDVTQIVAGTITLEKEVTRGYIGSGP